VASTGSTYRCSDSDLHRGRFSIGEIENLEPLGSRDFEPGDWDRGCKEARIGRDDVKSALVAEAQVEILGIGAIEESQPHQARRHLSHRRAPLTITVSPRAPYTTSGGASA
jgi:hypothetical protein